MCTVTYLPLKGNNFILTSSRDVLSMRPAADAPMEVETETARICCPIDGEAGGTWIGLNELGRAVVVLNGAFEMYEIQPFYRKSRGIIVREILEAEDYWATLQDYDLNNIEPFTLLIADWAADFQFWEFVWDGERKFFKQLDTQQPHIYSSTPLYDKASRARRQGWFEDWLAKNPIYSRSAILDFHENGGEGDLKESIMMDRGFLKTVSITSIQKHDTAAAVLYYDTSTDDFQHTQFDFRCKYALCFES